MRGPTWRRGSRAWRVGLLALTLLVVSGCLGRSRAPGSGRRAARGPPPPPLTKSYSTTRISDDALEAAWSGTREQLDTSLRALFAKRNVTALVLEQRNGQRITVWSPEKDAPGAVSALSFPTAMALLIAQRLPRGTEIDLIVPQQTDRYALTLYHEQDGALRYRAPQRLSSLYSYPPMTAALLVERFGVGRVENHNGVFDRRELQVIGEVLSLLSDEELALLAGIPILREAHAAPERQAAFPAGYRIGGTHFNNSDGQRRIEIYDGFLGGDGARFIGDAAAPHAASTSILMHEFGHAIAGAEVLDISAERAALVEGYHRLNREREQLAANNAGNAEIAAYNRRLARYEARQRRFDRKEAHNLAVLDSSEAEFAFAEIIGPGDGVTAYGRTSISESFAEAFALFRLDPEALVRISPDAHAFFEQGRHLPR